MPKSVRLSAFAADASWQGKPVAVRLPSSQADGSFEPVASGGSGGWCLLDAVRLSSSQADASWEGVDAAVRLSSSQADVSFEPVPCGGQSCDALAVRLSALQADASWQGVDAAVRLSALQADVQFGVVDCPDVPDAGDLLWLCNDQPLVSGVALFSDTSALRMRCHVQVSRSPEFEPVAWQSDSIRAVAMCLTGFNDAGVVYYWRVRVGNGALWGDWSSVGSFVNEVS